MDPELRKAAASADVSYMDYLLKQIKGIEAKTGLRRTIFAACPNSITVIRSALKSAKRNNSPVKFAATLNQVDIDGGYTGLTQHEFVKTIRLQARNLNVTVPVIIAVDHGGPWLKDQQAREKWSFADSMNAVKKSFEASIDAGYDLLHVDPTIDITLSKGTVISIDVVADRTVELITHAENFRRNGGYPRIAYEVGTEEVHGGLADLRIFRRFLEKLKHGLRQNGLDDVWPCFVVGKVGTDLHTTTFDPAVASDLVHIAAEYGSLIKGHYSDNVSNPEEYPASGMGAANIGPEFTEMEYEALCELENLQMNLNNEGKIAKTAMIRETLQNAVIRSGRWKKWLHDGENADDFFANSAERRDWLIRTCCRYIWEDAEVLAERAKLYRNLSMQGIEPDNIVESKIESAMDRYFCKFNLTGLTNLLKELI
ncbi:MAG TPA: class II D-tagatose-bisphosphate aldolase, non-catalytic subunit [Bacteroidales bacterium]|nr:class II D-tagatose-bisphosphate aldolase, non-catalytic subunit [Bacteroidales bacterium]